MEAVFLRYHLPAGPDDGYRGAVQELLAPWNENRSDLQLRLKRWLSRDQQRPPEQVETEASVLARWCGYLEEDETPVNAAVGLAYLYRYLDARAWRGGAIMVLTDTHHAQEDGDGLNICTALLDRSVGERPILPSPQSPPRPCTKITHCRPRWPHWSLGAPFAWLSPE